MQGVVVQIASSAGSEIMKGDCDQAAVISSYDPDEISTVYMQSDDVLLHFQVGD